MEKYSQDRELLLNQLRDEEHQLMLTVSRYMSMLEKTAEDNRQYQAAQDRLPQVRSKISELERS